MQITSNCHTHTQFCDGKSSAEEMVLAALRHGLKSLGFTSHAPQMFDPSYCIAPSSEADYITEIQRLRGCYEPRLRIWLGIERDLFSCASPLPYDYYIASVHYLPLPGGFVAVDGNPEILQESFRSYFRSDSLCFANTYYGLIRAYACAYRPPIIGHFDLIKKYNSLLNLFDENDPAYRNIAFGTLRCIRDCGCLLEVNTGGIARGRISDPYPSRFLLEAWHEMGGDVIVSSDCHDAEKITCAFEDAVRELREIGFRRVTQLGTGKTLFERTEL